MYSNKTFPLAYLVKTTNPDGPVRCCVLLPPLVILAENDMWKKDCFWRYLGGRKDSRITGARTQHVWPNRTREVSKQGSYCSYKRAYFIDVATMCMFAHTKCAKWYISTFTVIWFEADHGRNVGMWRWCQHSIEVCWCSRTLQLVHSFFSVKIFVDLRVVCHSKSGLLQYCCNHYQGQLG